jgi:hypothetical protein
VQLLAGRMAPVAMAHCGFDQRRQRVLRRLKCLGHQQYKKITLCNGCTGQAQSLEFKVTNLKGINLLNKIKI